MVQLVNPPRLTNITQGNAIDFDGAIGFGESEGDKYIREQSQIIADNKAESKLEALLADPDLAAVASKAYKLGAKHGREIVSGEYLTLYPDAREIPEKKAIFEKLDKINTNNFDALLDAHKEHHELITKKLDALQITDEKVKRAVKAVYESKAGHAHSLAAEDLSNASKEDKILGQLEVIQSSSLINLGEYSQRKDSPAMRHLKSARFSAVLGEFGEAQKSLDASVAEFNKEKTDGEKNPEERLAVKMKLLAVQAALHDYNGVALEKKEGAAPATPAMEKAKEAAKGK